MKKDLLNKVSLIIKTFERPEALYVLLKSIDRFYGKYRENLNIYIADDSKDPKIPTLKLRNRIHYFTLPFDSGVSKGRNFLLEKVKTKYFITLDDDFVFSRKTKIENFVSVMENNPDFDILGGSVFNYRKHWWQKKKKIEGNRSVAIKDKVLKRCKKPTKIINGHKIFDFIIQFFIAKTEKIRNIGWNENLKTVEHTAFFLDCMKNDLIVAEHPTVRINHLRHKNRKYKKFRVDRAGQFIKYLHEHYGFDKDIEVESL